MQEDPLYVKVNKLSSTRTQLPYEYYSLPFCQPDKIINVAENLGEVLRGDRIENSPYQVGHQLQAHTLRRTQVFHPRLCRQAIAAVMHTDEVHEAQRWLRISFRLQHPVSPQCLLERNKR